MGGHDGWGPETYSGTGGVKPMSITGRVGNERERTVGMSPEEREWRRKWVADQRLLHEPRYLACMEKEMINPIRRFYRFPLKFLFGKLGQLVPAIGPEAADVMKFYTGRILMGWFMFMGIHYYMKYNMNNWEGRGRWRMISSKEAVYPGEPGYPHTNPQRQPHEYYDRDFHKSIFAKNYPQYQTFKGEQAASPKAECD